MKYFSLHTPSKNMQGNKYNIGERGEGVGTIFSLKKIPLQTQVLGRLEILLTCEGGWCGRVEFQPSD